MRSDIESRVAAIAMLCRHRGYRIATAESITAGRVAAALSRGESASEWMLGGLVAYSEDVKRRILSVTADSLVSAQCAQEMAAAAFDLFDADVTVATTGVGGPDPVDGAAPGTVYVAVATIDGARTFSHTFDGNPADVLRSAQSQSLAHLHGALIGWNSAGPGNASRRI